LIRTIIVEDDIEMLNGLLHIITWEDYGYVIVGKAENGVEALNIVKEKLPDLIITDITMPKMNGLDLIKSAKEYKSGIKSIIISCNEDFNYAREAIKLEADDYILKHTITKESLINTLEQFRRKFVEERQQQTSFEDAIHKLKANKFILLEQFFSDISEGILLQDQEILHQAKKMNLKIPEKNMRIISMYIDNLESVISDHTIKEYSLLKFAFLNVMEETIGNSDEIILFPYDRGAIGILYDDTLVSTNTMQQLIKKLISNATSFLHLPLSACFSCVFHSMKDIGKVLKQNEVLRSYYFYSGSLQIILKPTLDAYPISDLYQTYGADFKYLLSLQNKIRLKKYTEDLFSRLESEKYDSTSVKQLLRRLEIDMKLFLEKYQINLCTFSLEGDTFDHLKKIFFDMIDCMFEQLSKPENKSSRPEIKKVLIFISTHIGDEITCENMASYINMNSNYFSRLFKNEMGIGFSEYLLNKRIHIATELLKNSDCPIHEISRIVGFESPSYFHRAYKKVTGITPGDAREYK